MEYKAVHIITNDDGFLLKLNHTDGIEFQLGAEDFTEEEGLHYHYHVHWLIKPSRALSPSRQGAVKRWRQMLSWGRLACNSCYNRGSNYACPVCGLYYKFIWSAGPAHHQNIHRYIQDKIDEDPTCDVTYVPTSSEEESGSEDEDQP